MMVRIRFAAFLAVGLVASSTLVGCFGTGFDKGDSGGVGYSRPPVHSIDQARTGGLGSPRGQELIGPGETGPANGAGPGVGAK